MVYNYNLTEIKIIQVDQYKSYIFEYIEADLNVIKNVINIKVKIILLKKYQVYHLGQVP